MGRTSINSVQITNGSIVDIDIDASAAIVGSKIIPNFVAQDVSTTGKVSAGTLKVGISAIVGYVLTALDINGNVGFTAASGADNNLNPNVVDLSYSGITFMATAGELLSAGDICYRKSDGNYWKTDANTAATMPGVVLATAAISALGTGMFLSHGFYRNNILYNWIVGGILYASEVPGAMVQTAPVTSGAQVQVLGYAYSADVIYFTPSLVLVGIT